MGPRTTVKGLWSVPCQCFGGWRTAGMGFAGPSGAYFECLFLALYREANRTDCQFRETSEGKLRSSFLIKETRLEGDVMCTVGNKSARRKRFCKASKNTITVWDGPHNFCHSSFTPAVFPMFPPNCKSPREFYSSSLAHMFFCVPLPGLFFLKRLNRTIMQPVQWRLPLSARDLTASCIKPFISAVRPCFCPNGFSLKLKIQPETSCIYRGCRSIIVRRSSFIHRNITSCRIRKIWCLEIAILSLSSVMFSSDLAFASLGKAAGFSRHGQKQSRRWRSLPCNVSDKNEPNRIYFLFLIACFVAPHLVSSICRRFRFGPDLIQMKITNIKSGLQ